jgi:copper chaperone
MDKLTMQITGMTCGHCVAGVTRALKGVPGVTVDQVAIGTASVAYDPTATTPADITTAVEDEGYHVVSTA